MARAQVREVSAPERIQGVASPVSTYVRPADPARSSLHELAEGLSAFDTGLGSFMAQRKAETDEADKARAITDFHRNNQETYAEAVRTGKIPATASKSYVQWYKKQQGHLAGLKLQDKFSLDYQQWEGRDSDDPQAFSQFVSGWMTKNVGEDQDPDILAGLAPHLDQMATSGYDTFSQERATSLRNKARATSGAIATDTLVRANDDARATGSVDYEALWGNLMAQREEAISKGERGEDFDKLITESVILQAEESGSLDMLKILDKKLPGQDLPMSSDPTIREAKLRATGRINGKQAQQATDIAQTRERLEKQRHEELLSQAVLELHNGKDVPEETIKELSRRDGEIRHKLAKYKKEYQDQETDEDPQALMEVYQEIDSGAGKKFVLDMREKGVIKDPATFLKAMDRADAVAKAIGDGGVFSSPTYKDTVKFITDQTGTDQLSMDGSKGLSDEGLEALYDYRNKLLDWDMKHPDSSLLEKEKAAREIGDFIRSRIQPATSPDATTKQEYLSEADAAKQAVEPQEPPQAVEQAEPAEEGSYIPQAVRNIWDYFTGDDQESAVAPAADERGSIETDTPPIETLSQTTRQSLEAFAKKKGLSVDEAYGILNGRIRKLSGGGTITPPPENTDSNADQEAAPAKSFMDTVLPSFPGGGPVSNALNSLSASDLNPINILRNSVQGFADNVNNFEKEMGQETKGRPAWSTEDGGTISTVTKDKLAQLLSDPPKVQRLTSSNVPVSPILDLVSGTEGTEGDDSYNVTLANGLLTGGDVNLVDMSLGELDDLQLKMLSDPDNKWNSSAVGRYQITRRTLGDAKRALGLTDDMKFDKGTQNQVAMWLLERRGLSEWQAGTMSDDEFMDNLSKEWASLPRADGQGSYGQRLGTDTGGVRTALNQMRNTEVASLNAEDAFGAALGRGRGLMDLVSSNKRGYQPDLDNLHPEFRDQVSDLQADFGKELPIVSGFRDTKRNKKAGGAQHSQHIHGNAVDIDVSAWSKEERFNFIRLARQKGFGGIGVYPNSIHIDTGRVRAWGPTHHKESIPSWALEALNS